MIEIMGWQLNRSVGTRKKLNPRGNIIHEPIISITPFDRSEIRKLFARILIDGILERY